MGVGNPDIQQKTAAGCSLEFDEDGFFLNPASWTPETAHLIAEMDDIAPLTPDHWVVIIYIREYYFKYGTVPLMRRVCRANNLNKDSFHQLFGGCKRIWRVAGLPNPGEEAKAYMS